ncbi:hypothetical protein HAX54_048672, partial [Datura stramonium]|nr:hypothetical protein [Datura stramonium]
MFGIDLERMTFDDSPIGSGHCFDPVLYQRFVDLYRRLTALSLVYYWYAQSSTVHQKVRGTPRIPPAPRRCFTDV